MVWREILRRDSARSGTRELIAGYIDALNLELNRWEQIKSFTIAEREFSVETDDLTPSMKLRRKVVIDKFIERLSALYEQQGNVQTSND